ncbi:hypothetical protein SAMN02746065_10612 [Desulfocicer vacuolatum DSM 3385]|uniref:Uncharacterized protein n=1 Tax=Desulfocicer vacuolatum DSM 3385 TaxID=1121400 RepID=A0A1W2AQH5_9BACT|nr:hypothetical protein [Desulfocicer vacuolatum]SMC62854.1 hypothetical protein SAMN02746065_10612 [Desulfocicer vacuolatum DSM 3385]
MKILHIFRSRPDETVDSLMVSFSDQEEKKTALYEADVDWDALVDDIFSSDKVISWW